MQENDRPVLVAEDEELIRNIAKFVLERAGFRLIMAQDGEAAIELFRQNQHLLAAAVIDLTMPKKDGFQVIEAIRAVDSCLPIVMMTGYTESALALNDRLKSNYLLLHKPFSHTVLLEAVLTAIGAA